MRDWEKIGILEPNQGKYGVISEAIRLLAEELQGEKPNLITVFSPLSIAVKLADEDLVKETMKKEPELMCKVLENITQTNINFTKYCVSVGGDSLYFPTQTANYTMVSDEEFEQFELGYDIKFLQAIEKDVRFRILHMHGDNLRIESADRFPVEVLNWADGRTVPPVPLSLGKRYF